VRGRLFEEFGHTADGVLTGKSRTSHRTRGACLLTAAAGVLGELQPAIEKGIETVQKGGLCLIDARVLPGYGAEG